jgi:hypothetical protein
MHELIVAATQQNWPIIKAHIERMGTIFEAIIREGAERCCGSGASSQIRVRDIFTSDSDRALRSTRRRYRSRPA